MSEMKWILLFLVYIMVLFAVVLYTQYYYERLLIKYRKREHKIIDMYYTFLLKYNKLLDYYKEAYNKYQHKVTTSIDDSERYLKVFTQVMYKDKSYISMLQILNRETNIIRRVVVNGNIVTGD
jgi:hypothetical protein